MFFEYRLEISPICYKKSKLVSRIFASFRILGKFYYFSSIFLFFFFLLFGCPLTKNKPSVKRGLHVGHFYCQRAPSAVNNRISCEIKNYKIE